MPDNLRQPPLDVAGDGAHADLRLEPAGAPEGEAYTIRIRTAQDGHSVEREAAGTVQDGYLSFSLPPFSSVILSNE